MDEVNPVWPQQEADGRYCLRPSMKKLLLAWLFCAVIALVGCFMAVTPARPAHPLDPLFGGLTALIFVPMILVFPFAVRSGLFTLVVDDSGFSDDGGFSRGKKRCDWVDVAGAFHLRADMSRFKLLVRYRTGMGMRQILNLYPMSTETLAQFMNARLKAAGVRTSMRLAAVPSIPGSLTSMRRIQFLLWLLIVASVIGTVLVLATIKREGWS